MKKLILAGAIVLFGLSNAQITRGNVYLTGQIGYSKKENKNIDVKIETLKIIPTIGFFIGSNLSIGTGIGYTNSKSNTFEVIAANPNLFFITTRENRSAVVVNPFVRKYWTLSENLYFFGQLEIPMEFGKTETYEYVSNVSNPINGIYSVNPATDIKTNYTSIGVNVKPGLDYFLNKNWSIEATIGEFGYKNLKYKETDAKALNNYNFGLNLSSITFGVKYIFAK
ncbi:outer membrane beta-barrel protein [Chryseobacterium taiwanense]|uniref:Opacity protein n=1 Tax=Chryseobacterium taiwanense TaxID=363331 RepID=A0A0B4DHG7_9FLAO|nr:outer membrane beta-barrel protein [Chryseobacterium taiwanense]KIC63880.1 opacity protein [Chryseobacterium taiwanense]